jgi:hypothetical protein
LETAAPRTLPFRFYFKWYAVAFLLAWVICIAALTLIFFKANWSLPADGQDEVWSFSAMLLLIPAIYLWWIHPKITQTVQIFHDHIRISNKSMSWDVTFNEIEKIETPFHSFIKLKMRDHHTWWFSAALERPDYLWEGLMRSRPELIGGKENYEKKRLELVQYDHHEKRKEWFFRHKLLDVVNWMIIPALILSVGYWWQSSEVVINSGGLYFFRLTMYSMFATMACAFIWSVVLKKFVFDSKVKVQMQEDGSKLRDLEFEDSILQKAKFYQAITTVLVLGVVIKTNLNMYSLTKLKEGAQAFNLTVGKTIVVDNRFNCVACAHPVQEGDLLIFGRGTLGEVLALPGEVIAQTRDGSLGRSIASETVVEVPEGHIALKTGANGQEVILIPIGELVGRLKKE